MENEICGIGIHLSSYETGLRNLSHVIRKLIEQYKKEASNYIRKTECMHTGGSPKDISLENRKRIKLCEEYKYLELTMTKKLWVP